MTRWFDRGANQFHELSWHIDCAWSHMLISLLWQELVGGGGISRPPDKALHGDDALPLVYLTLELLTIGTIVSFPLTCEE